MLTKPYGMLGEQCRKVDRTYQGTTEGEVGPVQRLLESYGDILGLVIGQYGEASQGVHDLVSHAATSRAGYLGKNRGKVLSERERSEVLSSYRRRLSITAVRTQARAYRAWCRRCGQ